MSASKLKGSLLEYVVRNLFIDCGFTQVVPNGLMIYKRAGLTMINGKGAAHDADVLMNPPIQMPFSYPFRLIFECKSYKRKTDLSIIRNALGLRQDINEFEIVTRDNLLKRQNNRRSSVAIDGRQRFNYQVGVASVEEFTRPAFEYAANNKIPLLSLRWLLPDNVCDLFHEITDTYVSQFTSDEIANLLSLYRGERNSAATTFLRERESKFKEINDGILEFQSRVFVGLLESGDLLFLLSEENGSLDVILSEYQPLTATFHYERRERDFWRLTIQKGISLGFYLPVSIMEMWKNQNFEKMAAIEIKSAMFSKVFIFTRQGEYPFRIVNINREWLDEISVEQ